MTSQDCFDYVKRMYGVNPFAGQVVRHQVTGRIGEVVSRKTQTHYVHVRFRGFSGTHACHPKELDYDYRESAS